jgi:GxxExxY protein
MPEEILYKDLSFSIVGAAMKVHRDLGFGFLEKVYENSLMVLLARSGLTVRQQMPVKVKFDGVIVGDYVADILVDEKIILELKAKPQIALQDKAQTLNYLRATDLRLAILFNFGQSRLEYHRVVNG